MEVDKDCIITIHYTIKDSEGNIVDSSVNEEPLEYLHGHDMMLPGLEHALNGRSNGSSVALWLEPDEGFGLHDEDKILELDRTEFSEDAEIEAGMEFDIEDEEGEGIITILSVQGEKVIADRNHPLAGKKLYVEAEILNIKKAEDWEIKGWKHRNH